MKILPYVRKVQFYETDQMGIVHHSNYIRWFEEARVDYMEKLGFGYEKANELGIDFAVLNVSCEYKSMVRFGEHVKIYVTISTLEPMKMSISYKVLDKEDSVLRALGTSYHCSYHREKCRPVSLEREIPELYNIFKNIKTL